MGAVEQSVRIFRRSTVTAPSFSKCFSSVSSADSYGSIAALFGLACTAAALKADSGLRRAAEKCWSVCLFDFGADRGTPVVQNDLTDTPPSRTETMFQSLWMWRQEYQHHEQLPLAFNGTWPSWNSDLDNRESSAQQFQVVCSVPRSGGPQLIQHYKRGTALS